MKPIRPRWRLARPAATLLATALLSGCAAQMAYDEGRSLLASGNPAQALAKLEEASLLAPSSAEYRVAYLQTRDRYAQSLIDRADADRLNGRYDEAAVLYREALGVRAQQDRALSGLRMLDQHRRWDTTVKEAEAIAPKDPAQARAKLRAVLAESPRHETAAALLRRFDERTQGPVAEPALAAAYKRPISLEFKDAPLRTVFEVISRTAGLNFLFDKDVKTDQRTSIYLRRSTVEASVSWLLLTNQLEQRALDGNTVLIYPATQAKQREYQPLTVKSFYLANAEAKTIAATLKTIAKAKDVVVDEKLNLVILRDSPEAIRMAEKLVALHDVPEPEVMLEVEVLEVQTGRLLDLGITWPDQATLSVLPTTAGGALTLKDFRNLDSSRIGVAVGGTTVSARKEDTDTNLLANPRIRARNREKAKILIGERVPNITSTSTSTGFVSESVNYIDVGLKLEVEPSIYLDNEVAIKVALEVSSIVSQQQTKSGTFAYQLGTRTAQTVLRLKDGENQVLAGLINDEDRRTAKKVPGLGELPLLGRLFGGHANDTNKTEIILSITPRILRNVQRPDAAILEFESGTESSLRSWPSDAGGSPAASPAGGPIASPASPATAPGPTAMPSQPPALPSPSPVPPPSPSPIPATTGGPAAALPAPAGAVTAVGGVVSGITQLRWEGPTQGRANDTFSLQLAMQSEQPIKSVPIVIGFDPKVLQPTGITEGGFLRAGGATTTFSQTVLPNGQARIDMARNAASGATAPGVLATLGFKVLPGAAAGSTRIEVLSIAPTGTTGQGVSVGVPGAHVLAIQR